MKCNIKIPEKVIEFKITESVLIGLFGHISISYFLRYPFARMLTIVIYGDHYQTYGAISMTSFINIPPNFTKSIYLYNHD